MSDDEVLVEYPDKEEEMNQSPGENSVTDTNDDNPVDSDDLVEVIQGPHACQIVSIGTEENKYAFTFHEEKLNEVMSQIPLGWKVSVVSVVGAFRTGKSFLLSWFLRYLNHIKQVEEKKIDPTKGKWFEQFDTLGNDGFDWRGGAERNTTGIWMWSEPHFVQKESGEQIAVLLVDTQGMFDHETTMALTASIFGLSTLLSSYQIYNVDKRIQEDNLQQLALFSEYARMAMASHDDGDESEPQICSKPFQKIEFLVRDWQNFEEEEDYEEMSKEMEDYLQMVIAERDAKDLQDTRDQILSCFESINCFGLVHPGTAVTKKKYTGEIKSMDPTFLNLIDRYCRKVFDIENMAPKIIHGRELSAVELGSYIRAYADLFASGAKFPEAATLLDATSSANNTNAVTLSISEYKEIMDRIAGVNCSNYVRPDELKDRHREVMDKTLNTFKSIANFGNQRNIEEAKTKLLSQVDESFKVYSKLNESRNPLAGFETYVVPVAVALVAYTLRLFVDTTCSSWSTVCRGSSDFLAHLFAVVMCFLMLLAGTKAQQVKLYLGRLRTAIQLLMSDGKEKKD